MKLINVIRNVKFAIVGLVAGIGLAGWTIAPDIMHAAPAADVQSPSADMRSKTCIPRLVGAFDNGLGMRLNCAPLTQTHNDGIVWFNTKVEFGFTTDVAMNRKLATALTAHALGRRVFLTYDYSRQEPYCGADCRLLTAVEMIR